MTCLNPDACQKKPDPRSELCKSCSLRRAKAGFVSRGQYATYLDRLPDDRHAEFVRMCRNLRFPAAESMRMILEDIAAVERRKARMA